MRRAARNHLLPFIEQTHPRWETAAHHVVMCRWLEMLEAGECPAPGMPPVLALAVEAPPRHGKTEQVSRRFPAWCMGRHPEWQMICAQATGLLAQDTGANVRDIIASPEFKRIFPGVELKEDAKAAGRWLTSGGGIYYAAGCDGTIVGRGANLLDIDDPHGGREQADSPRMRERVRNWYYGDALMRLMTPARQLLTLTRWHEADLAGAILPDEAAWIEVPGMPHAYLAGSWYVLRLRAIEGEGTAREAALWPGARNDRFPLDRLHEIKSTLVAKGKLREWNSQYQQEPVAEEGGYFRRAWTVDRWAVLPPALHYYIASDYAVTDKSDAPSPDFTEHGVFGLDPLGVLYVVDWWAGQESSDVWIERLLDLVDRYKPLAVFGTVGQIRRAVEPFLKVRMRERGSYARVEWLPDDRDKAQKGRAMQAMASSGRLRFRAGCEKAQRVIDQLVKFPAGRHDDAFDALANICRAIDQLHPAVAARGAKAGGKVVDSYTDDTSRHHEDWKTS